MHKKILTMLCEPRPEIKPYKTVEAELRNLESWWIALWNNYIELLYPVSVTYVSHGTETGKETNSEF